MLKKITADEKFCDDIFLPIFNEIYKWQDVYFSMEQPDFTPK